ncbi:hypothetical protein HDU98_005559 [Podochytrium sp. JEL0797]|nr:hypothetical protein HDU98_005559 [Podochytrium sp. JEL0797]
MQVEPTTPATHHQSPKLPKSRFNAITFRANTHLVRTGLAKRTITLTGSDNNRYRVISYFDPREVAYLYGEDEVRAHPGNGRRLRVPSQVPELRRFSGKIRTAVHGVDTMGGVAGGVAGGGGEETGSAIGGGEECGEMVDGSSLSPQDSIASAHSFASSEGLYQRPQEQVRPQWPQGQSPQYHPQQQPYQQQQQQQYQPPLYTQHVHQAGGKACSCGGLGKRRPWDYYQMNPNWVNMPVVLPPLLSNLNYTLDERL